MKLNAGTAIVIGTPGRLIDHIKRGSLCLSQLKIFILDEADEMLKMGFIDEVKFILDRTPSDKQTSLFSATMPPEIEEVAARYLKPNQAIVKIRGEGRTSDKITQHYLLVPRRLKLNALISFLELQNAGIILIFVRTRRDTTLLADQLLLKGYQTEVLNGEMNQNLREAVIKRLREKRAQIVVATDIAARGLDIDGITLVVNFDLPQDCESYIHRIGRTGRASQYGQAISLVTPREWRFFSSLQSQLTKKITQITAPSPQEVLNGRVQALQHALKSQLNALSKLEISEMNGGPINGYDDSKGMHGKERNKTESHIQSTLNSLKSSRHLYQEIIHSLEHEGYDLNDILVAALKLSTRTRPLDPRTLPKALPSLNPETIATRQRPVISSEVGNSILQLNIGRSRGIRPKDVVGAIANEVSVDGRLIGAIRVENTRTLIEIPDDVIHRIKKHLEGRSICGVTAFFELWNGEPERMDSFAFKRRHNRPSRAKHYSDHNGRDRHSL